MLDRPARQKLSALDLARRVEAGELTPEAIVDLCAAAIAAREEEVGAFIHLDLDAARANARKDAETLRAVPLRGLTVGMKDIYDTPTCRPNTARPPTGDIGRRATPRRSR